ncbi:sugar phosphorylase [Halanaerobium salsuginis]|uniref:Sucrose 6(F)-phosphate phosphorylase n=1 Tax=Halanaerobium salsuginis TaxID=29563 RepID=A0A1I4IGR5_9FIRM|nr:sugar phosphorylase [Halanaerobium salsuginis]SFL53562.1 sucrose phosphorylase [Halanaerobium salsuginis]
MNFTISEKQKQKLKNKLVLVYSQQKADLIYQKLENIIQEFANVHPELRANKSDPENLTAADNVVICYGDHLKGSQEKPLQTLRKFFENYLADVISIIHILPFFPYSSDDGFAVINYKAVDQKLGNWKDINDFRKEFSLLFDAVINHISASSDWFQKYLAQKGKYSRYFIEVDPELDLSEVTRPRAKPLLTEVETVAGLKYVWTTFSPDQIDLNFKEPAVLLEIITVLLFYAAQGARIIRLDAIAYLWKEIGTSCIHLPETHQLIQLFKEIFEIVAPKTLILTETNVPHAENISYFGGSAVEEADLVYQFVLPPLVLYTFLESDSRKLTKWAKKIKKPAPGNYFFNFLASHDGIGLRPAEGILNELEIEKIVTAVQAKSGQISYKQNSDGTKSPYELNITYVDAIRDKTKSTAEQAEQFLASQAIMLVLQGIPGIYLHSLLGSENYLAGVAATGEKRTINREKLQIEYLTTELKTKGSFRNLVFTGYKELLKLRSSESAFDPQAAQKILDLNKHIFAVQRGQGREQISCLINVSAQQVKLSLSPQIFSSLKRDKITDLLTAKTYYLTNQIEIELEPYQICWLK